MTQPLPAWAARIGAHEQWIRTSEATWNSPVGVYGGFYAVRRRLSRSFPPGLILDDMFQPLTVIRQGYRSVLDRSATVIDTWPATAKGEFQRKVRTLAGNFQLVAAAPWVLRRENPVRFQLVSHKLFRLLVPYALMMMLVTAWILGEFSTVWLAIAALQTAFWAVALLGLAIRIPLVHRIGRSGGGASRAECSAVAGLFRFAFTGGPLWKTWSPTPALGDAMWGAKGSLLNPAVRLRRSGADHRQASAKAFRMQIDLFVGCGHRFQREVRGESAAGALTKGAPCRRRPPPSAPWRSAMAAWSPTGTRMPPADNLSTSAMPPTSVTIAGRPMDMACSSDMGSPSETDDMTNAPAVRKERRSIQSLTPKTHTAAQPKLFGETLQTGAHGAITDDPQPQTRRAFYRLRQRRAAGSADPSPRPVCRRTAGQTRPRRLRWVRPVSSGGSTVVDAHNAPAVGQRSSAQVLTLDLANTDDSIHDSSVR